VVFFLAISAAFGCALFNGVAAVLQKVSADKEARATSLRSSIILRLLKDGPYVVGIVLDFLAWALTLVAVHNLPLFVAQPIIALSVVVTLLIEIFIFHRKPGVFITIAICLIVIGLFLLMASAGQERAQSVSEPVKAIIITTPLLLAVAGIVFVRGKGFLSTSVLAGVSGLAFGGTSLVGRMLYWHEPYWRVIVSPLFIALIAYGLVGILLFTVALQRHMASVINAIMIIFETLTPICIGLLFLGDRPRHGLWLLMVLGVITSIAGIIVMAAKSGEVEDQPIYKSS
jgi:drug/metabolite transporter (DMT)-like permease